MPHLHAWHVGQRTRRSFDGCRGVGGQGEQCSQSLSAGGSHVPIIPREPYLAECAVRARRSGADKSDLGEGCVPSTSAANRAGSIGTLTEDHEPISVLLVDHEPTDRLLLRRWIERSLDVSIQEASNGLEALELLSAERIELVVSELNLPQLSGLDLLTLLDADPRRKQMEILVASRNASEDVVRQTIGLGISDYLLKPLQYDWVIQRLRAAAERVRERRGSAAAEPNDSLKRVLFADSDSNFAATVEAAVFGVYSFRQSCTVSETLVHALRFRPEAVFVSRLLPGLRFDFLIDRVRKLPGMEKVLFFELSHDGGNSESQGVDGVLECTYVPDKLRAAILRLLGDEDADDTRLGWINPVASGLGSAVSQTFGMLTGDDVSISDEAQDSPEAELFGSIHVDELQGPMSLLVEMWCTARLSACLTGAMLGEELPENEAQPDVINEALNVIGGRLKHAAEERDVEVKMGLPKTTTERPEPVQAVAQFEKSCTWKDETFLIRLSVTRGASIATTAPSEAPVPSPETALVQ